MLAGKGSSFGLGKYEILNHPPLMGEAGVRVKIRKIILGINWSIKNVYKSFLSSSPL